MELTNCIPGLIRVRDSENSYQRQLSLVAV